MSWEDTPLAVGTPPAAIASHLLPSPPGVLLPAALYSHREASSLPCSSPLLFLVLFGLLSLIYYFHKACPPQDTVEEWFPVQTHRLRAGPALPPLRSPGAFQDASVFP